MKALGRYSRQVQSRLSAARRRFGGESTFHFAQVYLPTHLSEKPASVHGALCYHLDQALTRRGSRLAIAIPRGHAKSTLVSLAHVLYCLLYEHEQFILLTSNTTEQACGLLGHVRRELETNELLGADFPELRNLARVSPWRKNALRLPNGAVLMAFGTGQNPRGVRSRHHRPTLIIGDDLEDRGDVAQEEQRQKVSDWFHSTLLKAGTPETNVAVVGTILHHDALLARLVDPIKSPGWRCEVHPAVKQFSANPELWERWSAVYRQAEEFEGERGPAAAQALFEANKPGMLEDTRVLWPRVYPYVKLMETRLREGESAFWAEMQNQPLDPSMCIFANAKLRYWDEQHKGVEELFQALPKGGMFVGACDPSLGGDPMRGDYSAIVILYQPRGTRSKYIIAADLARRRPDEIVERILWYAKAYRMASFAVEANQFQQLLIDDLERRANQRGLRLNIKAVTNRSAKQQRISALEPEVSQGRLLFSRRHELLLDQLRTFPLGKHDDGPDALEMAVEACDYPAGFYVVDSFDGRRLYDSRYPDPSDSV